MTATQNYFKSVPLLGFTMNSLYYLKVYSLL